MFAQFTQVTQTKEVSMVSDATLNTNGFRTAATERNRALSGKGAYPAATIIALGVYVGSSAQKVRQQPAKDTGKKDKGGGSKNPRPGKDK